MRISDVTTKTDQRHPTLFSTFHIAGREMTIREWCIALKQDPEKVTHRLYSGWEVFDALNVPTN